MRDSVIGTLLLLALAGTAAGCGSGTGSGLTTGSLFGGEKAAAVAAPAPKPVTPSDRAVQVAATTARAQRCGFYFEPEQLKASYLAAEEQGGLPPDQLQKITKEFDTTRVAVVNAVAKDDGYCTEGRAREIKASLNRHLAGDFNPAATKQASGGGGFLDGLNQGKGREVFMPEEVFNPRRKSVTRREEE